MRYFFEVVEEQPIPKYDSCFKTCDVEEEMAMVIDGNAIVDPGAVTMA